MNTNVAERIQSDLSTMSESLVETYNRLYFAPLIKHKNCFRSRKGFNFYEICCRCMNVGEIYIQELLNKNNVILTVFCEFSKEQLKNDVTKIKDNFLIEYSELINTLPAIYRNQKKHILEEIITDEIKAGIEYALCKIRRDFKPKSIKPYCSFQE